MNQSKKKTTLLWIISVAGKTKWMVAILAVVQMLQGICSVVNALLLRQVINKAVASEKDSFLLAIGLFVGVVLFQIALGAVSRFLHDFSSAELENRFKSRLLGTLLKGNYADITRTHSGEWMNRLTSDTTVVAGGAVEIMPGLMGTIVRLIGAVSAILWLEPRFFYVVIPGGLALIFLTYLFRKTLKRMHKKIQEADGKLRVFLQERLSSLLIVRTFAQEKRTSEQAEKLMTVHKTAKMKRSNFSNLCNIGFSSAMHGMYFLGVLFCGFGILNGTMTYGNFMAIIQLTGQVQSPFANITGFLPKYYAMIASAERLMVVEQYEEEIETEKELLETCKSFYSNRFCALGLENVTFTYQPPIDNDKNVSQMPVVFKNLNLEIKKGEYVVFSGPSGCGKSTVLKLLMSLYPLDSGEAYILTNDDKTLITSEHRKLFAYVPQGNQLMTGTIREIVAFGDEDAMKNDEKLQLALQIACADGFVNELENGLDTMLGERGSGLSEGQMQRIAIARAVFSEHPILLLDEATSALDEATAVQMLNNLKNMTDKTVVMVTHRTENMQIFDKEVVFSKDGIIVKDEVVKCL